MRNKISWTFILFNIILIGFMSGCSANEVAEEYDVIVIGGEPEGVAAAVSAARNGSKTLLVEKKEELGGLFTYGMLNFLDRPQGEGGKSVSQGIYKEWHELVGGDKAFGIKEAKAAFKKLVDEEENITLMANTEVLESVVEANHVTAVKLIKNENEITIKGKTFIDATQDADFAVMAGAPSFVGGEDIGIEDRKMAVTLMIHLKNVDWKGVRKTAKTEKFGPAEVADTVAWGFSDLHYDYEPVEENTRLRGLNLVQLDDEYFINALQIFGVDGLDEKSIEDAIKKGERETGHILAYLQKEFPGFENAEVISYPTELYVRETRHILAEYQLPMSDVWKNEDHWDSIGFGAYPVDVQAQTPKDYGYVISDPKKYAIPFRSLIPLEIEDLLVVGRSTGYSSLAAGSARVVPTGMMTGEAAGVAANVANEEGISFREMSKQKELIKSLRERLSNQGAYVDHYEIPYPYEGKWFDESIQTLINYGLVVSGYNNDLNVDSEAKSHGFINMLRGAISRSTPEKYEKFKSSIEAVQNNIFTKEDKLVTRDEAAQLIVDIFFEDLSGDPWDILIDKGIVDKVLEQEVSTNRVLFIKETFVLNAAMIDYVKEMD